MGSEGHVFEDLPAYALGSLEPEEVQRLASHLETCSTCREELQAYLSVVEQLPVTAPQRAPAPELRQRILGRVSQTKAAPVPSAEPSWWGRVLSLFQHPVPAWALAGAFVLILALLAGTFAAVRQNQAQLAANQFKVVQLAGSPVASTANGWIVVSQDGQSGTLIVQNLPPLQPGKQYQLWLIQDGKRSSGGVFSVDSRGYASIWVYSPNPLVQYQQFGITIEPEGGSLGPTGAKVLGGKF